MNQPILSSSWLHENLNHPDLILLDASSSSNMSGVDSDFTNQKIPHSRFFDLKKDFSDPESPFPNTFPSVAQFEQGCRKLGIHNSSIIVVYDDLGIYQSPRVWWMFKAMGHEKVYVLDGGLPDWINSGFEVMEDHETAPNTGTFAAKLNASQVKDFDFVCANSSTQEHILVDVRSKARFEGTAPEPRAGLRSGNIPNSINIPYTEVLSEGKYKSVDALTEIFQKAGIDNRPITFSCGSGVTACILLLAAEMALENTTSVYDGSWTEYSTFQN
jgi:thiosulfate/3-mercaptopyruvate sulfurtransferase